MSMVSARGAKTAGAVDDITTVSTSICATTGGATPATTATKMTIGVVSARVTWRAIELASRRAAAEATVAEALFSGWWRILHQPRDHINNPLDLPFATAEPIGHPDSVGLPTKPSEDFGPQPILVTD